ncbi:hypothetical protein Btru_066820 [Bulinus truncatus]|nr:hypothetical protein Btru_066820 [Bulinus truncatus]
MFCTQKCLELYDVCYSFSYQPEYGNCTLGTWIVASNVARPPGIEFYTRGAICNSNFTFLTYGNVSTCVWLSNFMDNYTNSEAYCEAQNAHLYTLKVIEKIYILNKTFSNVTFDSWVGMNDMETENVFRWVDDNSILDNATRTMVFFPGGSVLLNIDPSTIELGLTSRLFVSCTFDTVLNPDIATVESIQLSKSNNSVSPVYTVMSTIDTFTDIASNSSDGKAKVMGKIDNNGISYLTLVWNGPIETEGGMYMCEAKGVDQVGRPKTESVTLSVNVVTPGVNELIHRVQSLSLLVDDMKLVVGMLNKDFI